MRRIPLRVRVVGAFVLAMAVVFAGAGAFIYARVARDLAHNLDQELRLRAQDLSTVVRDPRARLEAGVGLVERGESFAELVSPGGAVVDASPSLRRTALLKPAELERARRGTVFLDRPSVPGLDEPARLLATPVSRGVLVVGATRENRAEALRNLRTELLIAGPIALLLAIALGYPLLNKGLAGMEAALARERGFVAEASHELRTPLALLRAELDFALHHAETDAELREALREASVETDRLVQLAGSLLLIASSDEGRLDLRREPLAAGAVLDSVRNRFAWRAGDAGRSLSTQAPDGATLSADRLRLEQALGNLVDNALRHGAGDVRIEARAVDGRVELHVLDEGPGFPPDFLGSAFERFSRADEARSRGGTGLGLAITDAVARAHGGSAHAANREEGGADVWLVLPDLLSHLHLMARGEDDLAADG
jgi:signal transduction histidine kinase